jgi:4a-hydroxytetrahydrobiopterin dehydratase
MQNQGLKEKHCEPCEKGSPPLQQDEVSKFAKRLSGHWKVVDNKKLQGTFAFENFKQGMAFAQQVANIAEEENHHPDLCIQYKQVDVELSTHSIGGLSENDFIMAAKIDGL